MSSTTSGWGSGSGSASGSGTGSGAGIGNGLGVHGSHSRSSGEAAGPCADYGKSRGDTNLSAGSGNGLTASSDGDSAGRQPAGGSSQGEPVFC